MPAMMESAETRNCVSKAVCELSSSQESSSTQSVKEILRRRTEQKRVQQNNATFSNGLRSFQILVIFCEVWSIIAACGKIHGAHCRFDH